MTKQRGFSLVELLIVAVIGTLIVLAAYEVLVTNRRVFTVQNAKVQAQQSTRSAMEVLFGELREVSSEGSDILAFGPDSLAARSMREFGAVCAYQVGFSICRERPVLVEIVGSLSPVRGLQRIGDCGIEIAGEQRL